jgi:ABC-type transport system, involved in lipoprotein release, permease component
MMRRYAYIAALAASSAARRVRDARGLCLVFAAAAALATITSAAADGAGANALSFFEARRGGSFCLRGLERRRTGAGPGKLVEMSERSELEPFVSSLPAGSTVHERSDFRAQLVYRGRKAVALVRGLDMKAEASAIRGLSVKSGDPFAASADGGLIIGAKAAAALGARAGDQVILRTRDYQGRVTAEELKIDAFVEEATLAEDGSAWMELGTANRILGYGEGEFGYLVLSTPIPGPELEARAKSSVGAGLIDWKGNERPDLSWDDPSSMAKGLAWQGRRYLAVGTGDCLLYPLRILSALRLAATAVIAAILILASAGSSSSYAMILMDRKAEIGTLRAIGASRAEVGRMARIEAAITALASAGAGAIAGCALAALAALPRFGSGGELAPFLRDGGLAPRVGLASALAAIAASVIAAMIGTARPARKAAQASPARAFGEGL